MIPGSRSEGTRRARGRQKEKPKGSAWSRSLLCALEVWSPRTLENRREPLPKIILSKDQRLEHFFRFFSPSNEVCLWGILHTSDLYLPGRRGGAEVGQRCWQYMMRLNLHVNCAPQLWLRSEVGWGKVTEGPEHLLYWNSFFSSRI